jgi:hypothetical protein
MRKCGEFKAAKSHGGYPIKVYASKNTKTSRYLGCRQAMRIQRESWTAPKSQIKYHDGGRYWTLKRFPGWRCGSGTGGGVCSNHKKIAGYQNAKLHRFGPERVLARNYWSPCGAYPMTGDPHGKVKAHRVGCREARKIVNHFFIKAQTHGSPVMVRGFRCHDAAERLWCRARKRAVTYRGYL